MDPLLVFSIGDVTMLINAFNGIAAIFNDADNIRGMVVLGLVFSLLLVGMRAIVTQRLDLDYFFMGLLLYLVLFVPKADVTIRDVYTSDEVRVNNIPVGIAVPMAMVTQLGNYLTVTYETAFSTISMTQDGYADALNILVKFDELTLGTASTNSVASGDGNRTLLEYITHCAIYDANNPSPEQEVTWSKIEKATDTWDALQTSFVNRYVKTWIPGFDPEEGTERSCYEAYIQISAWMSGSMQTDLNQYLAYYLKKTMTLPAIEAAITKVGLTASATMLQNNALLRNLIIQGTTISAASSPAMNAATMRTQGMEQRKMQWATEHSLFKEVARPIMAFIESFVVCLAPVMCFMITLGPMGLQVVAKYMLAVAWISLWPPVMSMVNTYIHLAAERDVTRFLNETGVDPTSFQGLESLYTSVGTWVATGGMLAAAVPAITLAIVSGGVIGSAMAGRMNQGSTGSEKVSRPDLVGPSPVVQTTSTSTSNPNVGVYKTGTEAWSQNVSFNRGIGAARQQVESERDALTTTAGHQFTNRVGDLVQQGKSREVLQGVGRRIMAGETVADKMISQMVDRFDDKVGFNKEDAEAAAVAGRAALSVGSGASMPLVQAMIASTFEKLTSKKTSESEGWVVSMAKAISSDRTLQSAAQGEDSSDSSVRFSNRFAHVFGNDFSETWSKNEQASNEKSRQLQSIDSYQANYGRSMTMRDHEAVAMLRSQKKEGVITSTLAQFGEAGKAAYQKEYDRLAHIQTPEDRHLIAGMNALGALQGGDVALIRGLASSNAVSTGVLDTSLGSKPIKEPNLGNFDEQTKLLNDGAKTTQERVEGNMARIPSSVRPAVAGSSAIGSAPSVAPKQPAPTGTTPVKGQNGTGGPVVSLPPMIHTAKTLEAEQRLEAQQKKLAELPKQSPPGERNTNVAGSQYLPQGNERTGQILQTNGAADTTNWGEKATKNLEAAHGTGAAVVAKAWAGQGLQILDKIGGFSMAGLAKIGSMVSGNANDAAESPKKAVADIPRK